MLHLSQKNTYYNFIACIRFQDTWGRLSRKIYVYFPQLFAVFLCHHKQLVALIKRKVTPIQSAGMQGKFRQENLVIF